MKTNKLFKLLMIYITTLSIILFLLTLEKNTKIENYLELKNKQITLEYNSVYNQYKNLSQLSFDALINKPEVLQIFEKASSIDLTTKNAAREELKDKLSVTYKILKTYDAKQVHFHLKNNDSFLRMHRPNKFGDNIGDIRATVKYVNQYKKFIEGFEEGRIFNGYRFVYPLFSSDNKHLGSVELSFSAYSIIKSLNSTFKLQSALLIDKSIVDQKVFKNEKSNYIQSPNKNFYFEKSIYQATKQNNIIYDIKNINQMINSVKTFSIYVEKTGMIQTFIPLINPISKKLVASLIIAEKSTYIPDKYKNYYFISIIITLLLTIILYFFIRLKRSNNILEDENLSLDEKIKKGIKINNQKDLQLLNQAKMAAIGETLNNIAHHWRQPLSVITTSASALRLEQETKTLNDEDLELFTKSILDQSNYLSETIELFKEFTDEDDFGNICLQERITKALNLIEKSNDFLDIKINKDFASEDIHIYALGGEFSQVFMYILNNAKDSILQKNCDNKLITISVFKKEENAFITIEDTGTGIDESIIDNIFNPYFTTKDKSMGTGIGLYMSYEVIVNKLKGQIFAENTSKGAKITIIIKAL